MKAKHLNKQDFINMVSDYENNSGEWKFLGDKPALIDFYASWCGPCKIMSPVIDQIADEYAGRVDVYKIDVDEEEELATAFGVRSIPTMLFVPMSGLPVRTHGAMPKDEIVSVLERIL